MCHQSQQNFWAWYLFPATGLIQGVVLLAWVAQRIRAPFGWAAASTDYISEKGAETRQCTSMRITATYRIFRSYHRTEAHLIPAFFF